MFSERVQSREIDSKVRDEARERTRSRVLEAADRCFREDGYDGATVRGIASAAGVSTGTVMGVGDKQSLLIAVFDERIVRLHADPDRTTESESPLRGADDCVIELVSLVAPFVALFVREIVLSKHYAATLVKGHPRSRLFDELAWTLRDEFAAVLRRHSSEAPSAAGVDAATAALYAAYLGVLFSAAGRDRIEEEEVLELIRTVFGAVISGAGLSA